MSKNLRPDFDRHCARLAAEFYPSVGKGIVYSQVCRLEYIGIFGIDKYLDIEVIKELEPLINAYDPATEYILLITKIDTIEFMGICCL
jgi:hypothetical protein